MIRYQILEAQSDLDSLLESKKQILDLMKKVNGSMNTFHKEVKSLTELETLANAYFESKRKCNNITATSSGISIKALQQKIAGIKGMKATNVDFI